MHWTEIAAILLLAVAAVPVLVFSAYAAIVARGLVESYRRTRGPAETVATEIGPLTRDDDFWCGSVAAEGGRRIDVLIPDADGRPDTAALARVSQAIAERPAFERAARQAVAALDESYRLGSISHGAAETVEFEFSAGEADESFVVTFHDGRVTGHERFVPH